MTNKELEHPAQREAFEKWMTDNSQFMLTKTMYGDHMAYLGSGTEAAWQAWQASNAQSQELIAELLAALEIGKGWIIDAAEQYDVQKKIEAAIQKAKSHLKQQEQE